jgi:hypothetical protein
MSELKAQARPASFGRLFPWWRKRQPRPLQMKRPMPTPVLLPTDIEPEALLRWIFEQRAMTDDGVGHDEAKKRAREN